MDLKGVSDLLGKFKIEQRIFVLILMLVFICGTYIITSKFKKSDCQGYQTEINNLYDNIDKIQKNQNTLIKTNQELYSLVDSIQTMLIQKRKDDLKLLKEKNIINKSIDENEDVKILKSYIPDTISVSSTLPVVSAQFRPEKNTQ